MHAEEAAEPELYNVVQDPKQERDVIAENLPVAEELHAKYLAYLAQIGATEEQVENRRPLGPAKGDNHLR
jgi:hypothetical protein